ncbi:MAG: trigger factor [Actinomycetota bacterium]|nr:trigger factor [Actinomycetota bacterium]
MKTSVERLDDTTVKLSISVEADRVRGAIDAAARKLAGEVKVPGFRPGRVPRRVLESRLGKGAILEEAARQALPGFYAEAVRETELPVVGVPEFDVDDFEDGKEAQFSATVEVRPEIELPDYRQLQVPHPDWELTDEELDEQLQSLRERFAELETVHRPARAGDYVVVTVTGLRGGAKVEEASVEDALYAVDDPERSGTALDRELVGAQAGAILKFHDTLGADYGELAGQELNFSAIVKEVKAKRLPALDDDFALTASEFDTIEELREDLRAQLARQKLAQARAALRGRVVEALAEQVDVALPQAMVQAEARFRLDRLAAQAERHGQSLEDYLQAAGGVDEALKQVEDDARQTVKAQLVVDAAGRGAGIKVTAQDLEAEIARQAQRLGRPADELARLLAQNNRVGALVEDALRRKAIDHLVDAVQVLSAPPDDVEAGVDDVGRAGGDDAAQAGVQPEAVAAPEQ